MSLEGSVYGKKHLEGSVKVKEFAFGLDGFSPIITVEETSEGVIITITDKNGTKTVTLKHGKGGYTPTAKISEVKLLASKWVGEGYLFSQVVNIDGATANSQVNLTPSVEQLAIFYEKDLAFVTENEDGVVTVYVIGQKPLNDYTIQATITEVAYE